MLIRVGGGSSGIREYLERGHKQGRQATRDELDERVVLAGDLDATAEVIRSMSTEGERYLHLSLAFREDEVPRDALEAITNELREFAMAAFEPEEYSFYAEAHLPRIKGYINHQTGEVVERKPHMHVVIPKLNLLTGKHLNPFGSVSQNTRFIDAFQEHVNNKFGLASPKDHRRHAFTGASEVISRHKGDLFGKQGRELKEDILQAMLTQRVETYESFMELLRSRGDVRTRNAGRSDAYLNLVPTGERKGLNLKDHVFSREFVQLPTDEKRVRLSQMLATQYEVPSSARATQREHELALAEWKDIRAREVKYLNSGNRKAFAAYKQAAPEDRKRQLADLAERFYSSSREAETRAARELVASGEVVLPQGAKPAAKATGREVDNLIGQMSRDLNEAKLQRNGSEHLEFATIRKELDAHRMLAQLSHSHGLVVGKYAVTKGKDGSDRIKVGTRNLNVSDFLTKALHLPWDEAAQILRGCYHEQQQQAPAHEHARSPSKQLWREFQEHRKDATASFKERLIAQRRSEAARRADMKAAFLIAKTSANRAAPVDRNTALSVARIERIAKEAALRATILNERALLAAEKRLPWRESYQAFLVAKAQSGDERALAELRRTQAKVFHNLDAHNAQIHAIEPNSDAANLHVAPGLSFHVAMNGAVTYRRDGVEVIRDERSSVQMLKSDDETLEVGLRLAQQKFGGKLALTGPQEFQERLARIASDAGLRIQFSDPRLNVVMQERREEVRTKRADEAHARRLAQTLSKEVKEGRAEVAKAPTGKGGERDDDKER